MEKYLEQLYNLALESSKNGDIPVGCIIIKNGNILSTGHNTRKCDNLVIGHAEINAICEAEKILGDFISLVKRRKLWMHWIENDSRKRLDFHTFVC